MIVLDATTKKLELQTSAAVSVDYYACWADVTTTAFTPGASDGNTAVAGTVDLVVAPAASTQRQVKTIIVTNRGTATQTVTIKLDVSGTERVLMTAPLAAGEALHYTDTDGWQTVDVAGRRKVVARDSQGVTGRPVAFHKIGTAAEAVGTWYCWSKDTGFPGAWAPGAPGLNGRATDGTTAADNGCLPIANPSVGSNYLTGFTVGSSVAGLRLMADVLWVNTGLVVTTTTAQAIAAPTALPARDINGSTNGEGVMAGILVTTATTNAAAIANTTMSYTNSDGVAGRTATIASYPATAVIGTVVWFQLAAGDKGVRSIQSVTLGTSYVAGAISIILARWYPAVGDTIINIGATSPIDPNTGVRLYNGACLLPFGLMAATTATNISGTITVAER